MPATKVVVNLPHARSYDVRIGPGLIDGVGQSVRALLASCSQVALVSDSNVAPLYAARVKESLHQAGFAVTEITVPAGEESKSLAVLSEVWQALALKQFDRSCCIMSLGGGVVADLAGFAAAAYMRGVACVHIPTSLLAMVDAAVGGKTGVNLPAGKNLVGAFKQPAYVCADTATLATLPEREWICGLGEVAKTAVLDSDEFFFWLDGAADRLRAHDDDAVREAITRCVVFKADVVARDEQETQGVRACLNLGHTLGHAIEACVGYGTCSHGQAVAEGMRFAARLSAAVADASLEFVHAQDELLDKLGLEPLSFSAQPQELLACMHSDKKAHDGRIRFVLPLDVGSWTVQSVADDVVLEHLDAWARSKEQA